MPAKVFFILPIMFMACSALCDGNRKSPAGGSKFALDPPEIPTEVIIGVTLLQLDSIEPASQEKPKMTAQFKLKLQWTDKRLKFKGKNSLTEFALRDQDALAKLGTMFDPRIEIVDGEFEIVHSQLKIYANGTINLTQVVNVTVLANMDLQHFPFDNQIFNFQFASTYWDANTIDLILNPVETNLMAGASPESWNIDASSYYIAKSNIRAHSEEFYAFNFLVHAQRDPRYFIWRLLLPLIIIVILSWNVFWLYEDSTSALGNSFVFLLTVVAFHQIANGMLPLIPFFTFLDAIVFMSYGFIIIPTFQVMITTKLEHQGRPEEAERIRTYCRWSVPIVFALSMLTITLIYFSVG